MALSDFLNTFNNMKGSNAYVIDPIKTFKVNISYDAGGERSNVDHEFILGLDKDISPFIQRISMPTFTVAADTAETLMGNFQVHKLILTPDQQTFSMEIINTKAPLLENWLYPWMREITSPRWIYKNRPYTIAKMEIDLTSHANVKYVFNGVRPTSLPLIDPSQEVPQNITRSAVFTFDFVYLLVDQDMIKNSSASQLTKLANSLVQKIAKTVGL
jgi:hypothetical protein